MPQAWAGRRPPGVHHGRHYMCNYMVAMGEKEKQKFEHYEERWNWRPEGGEEWPAVSLAWAAT